jgi:hypothetical protein
VTRAITKIASTTTTTIDSGLRLAPIAVAQDTCLFHPCHGQDASDSATRTVDSLGGPAKDEHVKTVKCCVKQIGSARRCRELNPGLSGQEDQPELTDLHLVVIG